MLQAKAIVDALGNLTRLRDRDALEVGLAAVLYGLAHPRCLYFWRVLESAGQTRLLQCMTFDDDAMQHVPLAQLDAEATRPIEQWPTCWQEACSSGEFRFRCGPDLCRLLLPLRIDAGTVLLIEIESGDPQLADDAAVLATLVRLYANHLRLLDYAEKDTLTGLLNRKTFETQFNKLLMLESLPDEKNRRFHQRRRHRHSHPWIAVIDIDHFKAINDRFGHLYGDEVLILMANLMRRGIRANDWLYRFGGEEFVIVLAPTTEAAASEVFERLRQQVADSVFPQVGQVTVSIGYTRIRPNTDASTVLGEADDALYYAKDHGRNRVCGYQKVERSLPAQSKTSHTDAELF